MHTPRELEALWDSHGAAAYTLGRALLGDDAVAAQAITLAMTDVARTAPAASSREARRTLGRHVYLRSEELAGTTTPSLPPALAWLWDLAPAHRACLALCVFGGHTHREAAELLGMAPLTVAELLTAGLRHISGTPPGLRGAPQA